MKKIVLLLFLFANCILWAQEKGIPKEQIKAIKYSYLWDKEEVIIINYRFPNDLCPYENYENLEDTYLWLEKKVFAKIDMKKYRNVYVYADHLAAKKIIDDTIHFEDIGEYFLKHYFNKKGNCCGVIVINQKGDYKYIYGEYSASDIVAMIEQLK